MNALQHLVAERQIACQVDRTADVDGRKRLEGGRWLILSARERQLHVAEAVLRHERVFEWFPYVCPEPVLVKRSF
jgi:hypothetical protein